MRVTLSNNLYGAYAQAKNNKTKNDMTNSVSFGGPQKIEKALSQNTQNIASKAVSNINKALVKRSEKRFAEEITSNNAEDNYIRLGKNSAVNFINPKYDEKNNLISCDKKIVTKQKLDANGNVELTSNEIYENVIFGENEKLKSCDKETIKETKVNANGDKILTTKIYDLTQYYENGQMESYRKFELSEEKIKDNGKSELIDNYFLENNIFAKNGCVKQFSRKNDKLFEKFNINCFGERLSAFGTPILETIEICNKRAENVMQIVELSGKKQLDKIPTQI